MSREGRDMPNYPDYYLVCRRALEDTRRTFILDGSGMGDYRRALLDMATAIDAFIAEYELPDAWVRSESRMKQRYMDAYDILTVEDSGSTEGGG